MNEPKSGDRRLALNERCCALDELEERTQNLAAVLAQVNPGWSVRRCYDRALIEATKNTEASKLIELAKRVPKACPICGSKSPDIRPIGLRDGRMAKCDDPWHAEAA